MTRRNRQLLRREITHLVKVGLQEVDLRLVLEQARPELLLELLLAEDKCDIATAVLDLGLLGVDLGEELEVNSVGDLFRCRGTLKAELCRLQIELQVGLWDIGGDNGEEDVVLLGVISRRALRPGDCAELAYGVEMRSTSSGGRAIARRSFDTSSVLMC
jgi:hypothetical protein